MRTQISTVELRHTNGRSAEYHVDLFEENGCYVVSVRYGSIGMGLTRKDGSPLTSFSGSVALYDAKVKAKTDKGYRYYAGSLQVTRPTPNPAPPSQNPIGNAPLTLNLALNGFARLSGPKQPAPLAEFTEEVVYDDL